MTKAKSKQKTNPKTYGLKSLKEWLQILGKDFNKKNLNEYTSPESRNYAKNYRPTKVILKKFHDSNKSNDYMNSSEKKRKKGN